jgi:hypothetical protein
LWFFLFKGLESDDSKLDMELFLVSFIMSSLLIYNAKSSLTKGGLEKLAAVSSLRKSVRLDETDGRNTVSSDELPDFIWVVRDFSLSKTASAENRLRDFMAAASEERDQNETDDEAEIQENSSTQAAMIQISDLKKVSTIIYLINPNLFELELDRKNKFKRN